VTDRLASVARMTWRETFREDLQWESTGSPVPAA